MAQGRTARLSGTPRLGLYASLNYEIVRWDDDDARGPWKIRTRAYFYEIKGPEGQDILTFHWQPDGPGPGWPHLHVGSAVIQPGSLLDRRKHVPTGRVALEDVIGLTIELGAEPAKEDWEEILGEGRQRFVDWRTWG